MTLVEFAEQLIGSSNDPVIEIFALASGLIFISTFFSGFLGAVFSFFKRG